MYLMYKEDYNKLRQTDIAHILHGADVLKRLGIIEPEEHFYLSTAYSCEFPTDISYRGPLMLRRFHGASNRYEHDVYGKPFCKVADGVYVATCEFYNGRGESFYSIRDIAVTLITDANRYVTTYYRTFLDDFVKYVRDPKFMRGELVELPPTINPVLSHILDTETNATTQRDVQNQQIRR